MYVVIMPLRSVFEHVPRFRNALKLGICGLAFAAAAVLAVTHVWALGQSTVEASPRGAIALEGMVSDAAHLPLTGAKVLLDGDGESVHRDAVADASGRFAFEDLAPGRYRLTAGWHGLESKAVAIDVSAGASLSPVMLVINAAKVNTEKAGSQAASKDAAMEFADEPSFTIAGVTDWTAVGGHGSDASLRTSETLARQTALMQSGRNAQRLPGLPAASEEAGKTESELSEAVLHDPQGFRANHELGDFYLRSGRAHDAVPLLEAAHRIDGANRQNTYELALADKEAGDLRSAHPYVEQLLAAAPDGNAHRLAGEIDEAQGDPLTAVREFEAAVRLDPSEDNYFAWGSELLMHRAIWQAKEVFTKGATAYPKSSRMLTGLGASLFSAALYEQAAQRLCEASDLDPSDSQPYEFLGKIDAAAPDALPCIEQRLARFANVQPTNAEADYLYAAALLKRYSLAAGIPEAQHAEALLTRAVALDAKCGEAYLELGILSSSRHQMSSAVDFFQRAIAAKPELGEAHYRLAVAYDRLGKKDEAQKEFALHDAIEKEQADAVERQRREVKQFEVTSTAGKP